MYTYTAYGLGILSEFPIPELNSGEARGLSYLPGAGTKGVLDVTIQLAGELQLPTRVPWIWHNEPEQRRSHLAAEEIGGFEVIGGREIRVSPAPGAKMPLIRRYLLGSVMAFLLYQRGKLVLHASAVDAGGKAILVAGVSGAGKSSLAMAFCAAGCSFYCDDVAPLSIGQTKPVVHPGPPQVKLSEEACALARESDVRLRWMDDLEGKCSYRLRGRSTAGMEVEQPLPVHSIYVLGEAGEAEIQHLGFHEAVIELVRYSTPTRFRLAGSQDHFEKCLELARQVPVYRLRRPPQVNGLPVLARNILNQNWSI